MVLASSDEQLAVRFAPYIDELHDFFAGRSLPFGAPQDLPPFAERLTLPGAFHEEMSSMIRAVIYREQEKITQADLLGLITAAVAGPDLDLTAPELRTPVRQLLTFIGGALRSLWRRFPEEATTPPASAISPPSNSSKNLLTNFAISPSPTADVPPSYAFTPTTAPPRVIEEIEVQPETNRHTFFNSDEDAAMPAAARPGLFSRVRALWRDPEATTPVRAEDGSYPEYEPFPIFHARYRPLWLVGVCGAAIGLATGLMLRDRPPAPRPTLQRSASTLRPGPSPKTRPAYDPGSEMGAAAPNPVDTFQADNAALQAANAVLPPLPLPAKPTPYGPVLGTPAETTRTLPATKPASPAKPPASSPGSTSHSGAVRPAGQPIFLQPAVRSGGQRVLPSRDAAAGKRLTSPFTGAMSGQSRPMLYTDSHVPYNEAQTFAVQARRSSEASAFPLARPSEQARLATPMQPRTSWASPAAPYVHEHVFLSATGVMAGNLLSAPAPEYPQLASSSQVQGKVIVQAVIGTDGSVIAARVLSGPQFLRSAAENAVRRWRYRPFLVDGRPAVVATDAILSFQLTQ